VTGGRSVKNWQTLIYQQTLQGEKTRLLLKWLQLLHAYILLDNQVAYFFQIEKFKIQPMSLTTSVLWSSALKRWNLHKKKGLD